MRAEVSVMTGAPDGHIILQHAATEKLLLTDQSKIGYGLFII